MAARLEATWFASRLRGLYEVGEAAAGTPAERILAERVARIAEEALGFSVRLIPVPVTVWRVRSFEVSACGQSLEALPLPPSGPFTDSLDVVRDVVWARFRLDDPDAFLARVWRRWVHRRLVVVVDERLRRVVVPPRPPLPDSVYDAAPGSAAVFLTRRAARLARACGRLVVNLDVVLDASYGYIVEGVEGGEDVVFAAHHDHWLGGALDNLTGVLQAIAAAAWMRDRGVRAGFLSFTAEEFGARPLRGWYWAWGSRFYSETASWGGGAPRLIVVFDTAVGDVVSSGSALAGMCLEAAGGPPYLGRDDIDTDSFWFSSSGVASIAVTSRRLPEVYHSADDTPDRVDPVDALRAVRVVTDHLPLRLEGCVEEYFRHVMLRASRLPLPRTRQEVYRLYRAYQRRGVEAALALQEALSVPLEAVGESRWCLCLEEPPWLDWRPGARECPRLVAYGDRVVDACPPGGYGVAAGRSLQGLLDSMLAERLSAAGDRLSV
ncbi:MAG: hypothetical protein GXO15_04205 [Crenarchaeota archaeon]|nr:hypothetical protein [Thermoproteota archaeon]